MPRLRAVSEAWLDDKATAEKGFSVGFFDEAYLLQAPVAVVRTEGSISAFANLWLTGDRDELSVDLMRFGPDAPRGAMDYLFVELMLWGRDQGYRLAERRHGATVRARASSARARVASRRQLRVPPRRALLQLRRACAATRQKFQPVWEPKYLVAPGGLALPRILLDVSVLISGGVKELFAK